MVTSPKLIEPDQSDRLGDQFATDGFAARFVVRRLFDVVLAGCVTSGLVLPEVAERVGRGRRLRASVFDARCDRGEAFARV